MTSEQHAQRVRQLEFELYKADYGMGMPRDYQRVLALRVALEQAKKDAARAGSDTDAGGPGGDAAPDVQMPFPW